MINPLHSLAFSIQANPGVYAVLIGSGVSRSAQIPTGWEITLDLIRKLAKLENEDCGADPALWYRERYAKEPDYSDLLDELAKTPAERHQLLRAYLEPSEADRADGLKAPTAAHRAIAKLVAKGYIRIIITTNFDRLMETALADVGVVPTVLSSPDQVHGSMPVIHTRCCVFKVHGDYLDTRILNTPAELEHYPKEIDGLLDRIFDEFGLIVCGWSAEWDTALRAAIERTVSRRFPHFWAVCGDPSDTASRLMQHRQAQRLSIPGADSFFPELRQLIEGLEQFSRPHPLSTDAAVAILKGYLKKPECIIRLSDLILNEVDKVLETTAGPKFAVQNIPEPDSKTFTERVQAYEACCETLLAMAAVGGRWIEDWHHEIWQNALTRLATLRGSQANNNWTRLQRYPASWLLYTLSLGAMEAGEQGLVFVGKLFNTTIPDGNDSESMAAELLPAHFLLNGPDFKKLLQGMENKHLPLNEWNYKMLKPKLQHITPTCQKFTYHFDIIEIMLSTWNLHKSMLEQTNKHPPLGIYIYRNDRDNRVFHEINNSIKKPGKIPPYVKFSIFGNSSTECESTMGNLTSFIQKTRCKLLNI
ncbi:MAG: SIR2 family protein [Lautropia sp.]|nr:SIR2 family protein [Lautropia sp.]